MRIVYGRWIDAQGKFENAAADLEGSVKLTVNVKGAMASIEMPATEAAALFKALRKLDVETLAKIHAA